MSFHMQTKPFAPHKLPHITAYPHRKISKRFQTISPVSLDPCYCFLAPSEFAPSDINENSAQLKER